MAISTKVGDIIKGKEVNAVYPFKSKRNPNQAPYEVLVYKDNSMSCNCMGWTRQNKGGIRECKHTLLVDQIREQYAGLEGLVTGAMKAAVQGAPAGKRRFDLSL